MKKISFLILPAIFLSICAVSAFAQSDTTKTNKITTITVMSPEEFDAMNSAMEKLKQEMNYSKQKIDAQKNSLEYMQNNELKAQVEKELELLSKAQEIKAGQEMNLQAILFTGNKETAEPHYYLLRLEQDTQYTLIDPKTNEESAEKGVSWLWDNFLGKYEYQFDFRLIQKEGLPKMSYEGSKPKAFLVIKITPILSKDNEPTLPIINVKFGFNKFGDVVYSGEVRPINPVDHESFTKKIAKKVK